MTTENAPPTHGWATAVKGRRDARPKDYFAYIFRIGRVVARSGKPTAIKLGLPESEMLGSTAGMVILRVVTRGGEPGIRIAAQTSESNSQNALFLTSLSTRFFPKLVTKEPDNFLLLFLCIFFCFSLDPLSQFYFISGLTA